MDVLITSPSEGACVVATENEDRVIVTVTVARSEHG